MEAWSASIARSSQADLTRQLIEGHANGRPPQPTTLLGDEKIGTARFAEQGVAPFCVTFEYALGGPMQRQEARLAEFGGANSQHSSLEVHVLARQGQCFADAHPSHREQAKQAMIRKTWQSVARGV